MLHGETDGQQGISVEGGADHLILYHESKRLPPETIRHLLEDAFQVFEAFKSYSRLPGAS